MTTIEKKIYHYPPYVPSLLQFKGLLHYEWLIVFVLGAIPFFVWKLLGVIIGLALATTSWLVFYRKDGARENTVNQAIATLKFAFSQKIFIKRARENVENTSFETEKDKPSNNKKGKKNDKKKNGKKKGNKKQRTKKEKNMQDFFPFKYINDNYVKMENGDVYIFLRVNANSLNFMNVSEMQSTMTAFGKDFDRNKYSINFFIQDAVFKAKDSVQAIEKVREKYYLIDFLKKLGNEMIDSMDLFGKSSTKKAAYLRVHVKSKMLENNDLLDIIAKAKNVFKQSLSPSNVKKSEIKQMLAIFGNRLFASDFPDSEVEFEDEEETLLFKSRKKVSYEELHLPGVYEFKDMITPITARFLPSSVQMGSHIIKTYAVSSFIATTDDNSILSEIANIKGVTTNMYIENLSLSMYRNSVKLDIRSKNSATVDEIDAIDSDEEKRSSKDAYRRVKNEKQHMYYISVFFQLTAETKSDLDVLEENFLEKCSDVGLSVDPLETRQRLGYESVNPLGSNKLANLVKQNIPSESVANLYPFSSSTLMDNGGLPIGQTLDTNETVLYNMFADRGSNQNILILGFSGVGKTTLLWLLLQNEMLLGSYIRNIDVEGICKEFTEALGGINFNMAGNNEFAINPLQIRIPDELRSGLVDDFVSEVRNWMSIYKSGWSQRLLDIFQSYVSKVYAIKHINNDTNLLLLKNTDYPLMEDIYNLVQNDKQHYDPKTMNASLDDLREILIGMESCVKAGADAKLFNRYTNLGEGNENALMNENRFINFDLSEMRNSSLNKKLAQWSNIFTFIGQFVNENMDRSKRICVSIDELHTFLKKQYMSIVEIIDDYERRFRKYGAAFIKATQTIEEFDTKDEEMKSKITTLFSQPATKFLFHLGDIKYDLPKQMLNLKEKEVKQLQVNRNGQCLMRVGQQVFDLDVHMPLWFKNVKADLRNGSNIS